MSGLDSQFAELKARISAMEAEEKELDKGLTEIDRRLSAAGAAYAERRTVFQEQLKEAKDRGDYRTAQRILRRLAAVRARSQPPP